MNCIKELPTYTVAKPNSAAQERLKRKKCIAKLFAEGQVVHLHPVRFVYLTNTELDLSNQPQVLFTVSKKRIQSAVDRNIVKRRMRESYRQHKHLLTINDLRSIPWTVGCIYVGNNTESYPTIENTFLKAFRCISKEHSVGCKGP